jgi:hypothetical protein
MSSTDEYIQRPRRDLSLSDLSAISIYFFGILKILPLLLTPPARRSVYTTTETPKN